MRRNIALSLRRGMSSNPLRERLEQLVPQKREALQKFQKAHANKPLDNVTVGQAIGGMRSVKCMVWEISNLDAEEGIRYRGKTIPELQKELPKFADEPLPEALLWFLLTGDMPTMEQTRWLTHELHRRAKLPAHVENMIRAFPKDLHAMSQLSAAVLALQNESEFAKAYENGMNKRDYWQPTFEDSLNLIARLPRVAALIYRCKFHDGKIVADDHGLDYAANFNRLLGYPAGGKPNPPHVCGESFDDLMRLYIVAHADHEGGNVSAHATHLVGSALGDAYQSLSAGLNGLAGPLHGLANQEVLRWTLDFQKKIKDQGKEITRDTVTEAAWETLNAGNVIPGFGHAVLRKTDPRYMVQRAFALKNLPDDPLFKLVNLLYETIPEVLTKHGKTKNPWPNVDAHSGCLLQHFGFTEYEYYTVLFGVSRAFGVLSQLFWDRALGLPIERPKSVTLDFLYNKYKNEAPDTKPM